MSEVYRHKQFGTATVLICIAVTVMLGIAISVSGQKWVALIAVIVLGLTAWLFSSLTINVNANEVSWYFGPEFWRSRIARNTIQSVAIVQNHWWNGFGIRMRPGWRLYNVSGFDAVELRLQSGDIIRLGTDDPQGLDAALKS